MMKLAYVSLVAGLGLIGCGGGGEADDTGDDDPQVDAPPSTDPDANPDGWEMLIGRDWNIPAGVNDIYRCTRIMVPEDIYIAGFRSQAPLGSHHAVLTIANNNSGELGDYDCDVGSLDFKMLYASGVNTDDLMFPDGVGVFLPQGTYINLNLHLFNATDDAISGSSGVLVKKLAAEPPTLADMTFAGDVNLNIPGNNLPHVESGGCNSLNRSFSIVALWPHMHQYATHQKVEFIHDGVPTTVLDEAYSFSDQGNYPQTPNLEFQSGDGINVTCTYVNPGPSSVEWGDSSTEEMCFVGIYRYPAGGTLFDCINGLPPL
jgi:hypothetical protein